MTTPPESPAYATIREGIALREQGRSPEAKALMEPLVANVESGDDAYAKVFRLACPSSARASSKVPPASSTARFQILHRARTR
jgi:hypothetical protein